MKGETGNWRPLMELTRRVARDLVAEGKVEIMQKRKVVHPSDFPKLKGPIRLRLRRPTEVPPKEETET